MKIAIDAMGGDHAPQAIVEGVNKASKQFEHVTFLLYGDKEKIEKYLDDSNKENIRIIHTNEKIESDDNPVRSVRRKKKASMVLAAQAVKDGEADAIFSAGNTGALLAAGMLIVGRIKGIDRPGLMTIMPSLSEHKDSFLMLDVGANADSKPINLNQYATLGTYYAKHVLKRNKPTVGLLNNGTEENKGNELAKQAFSLLKENKEITFKGNIEARTILNGEVDVVVTDGFTGNAVLKTIEGTAISLLSLIKESIQKDTKSKLGGLLLKDGLKNVKNVMDYSKYGGAVLFGLKAPVVKTHGSANSEAVYYTIKQIEEMLSSQVVNGVVNFFETSNNGDSNKN
ncbi:phosphate acyltransferase PlsX [Lacticigenium naphthae]|uniref:phosphate acyltransferase PlsX n=1 Tax=Lacticigenium naphthae TaxID=515351 RepID=UPI00042340FB|nr:phosphate acyltransferase PlsX [Lacticigenium naphthae]